MVTGPSDRGETCELMFSWSGFEEGFMWKYDEICKYDDMLCVHFFFENPVLSPSEKLQFICSLFKVLNPTCATPRRGLSAGFFGSRNWRHPLERPSKWRWNVPRSVENDWSWKSAKHALFTIWRLGSMVKVVVCGHLEGWISWGWNVRIRFLGFFHDMPNDVLGILLGISHVTQS